jgi:broad specificity phosphatase PhoE
MSDFSISEGLVYLIRHGATDNNLVKPPRLQGRRTDLGLSNEGQRQAARTGRWLAGQRLDAVYASPLLRARQTAEEIAKVQGLSVEIVPELTEIDVGIWEELSWEEIAERWPDAHRLFMTDASIHPYLEGENLSTVLARAIPAMEAIMATNRGRRVAVVSHNGVNRAYLTHLLDVPLRNYRRIPQDNCGISLISHTEDNPKLRTLNAVWHLLDR